MFILRAGVVAVAMLVAVPSLAQDAPTPAPNPWFEVSFGYQGKVPVGAATTQATGSFAASFGWVSRGPSLALVALADMISVGSSESVGTRLDYSVLAGPRVRLRANSRLQPFAQALFGVVGSIGGSSANTAFPRLRQGTEFQVAPSVGVDLRVSRGFTLRLAQVEYRTFMGGDRMDRFSVYSGAVFGLGHRKR